ncbi:hypothetical protein KR026_003820 [Drosophila bipectinata]|nr:hypothetical protein KR026_003820 [Drosophila bipectinata]
MCKSVLISLAFLAVISAALAQSTPQTCAQASSLPFDNAAYNGTWFEVARNPAPAVGCITLEVNVQSQYVQVNVSHSISTTNLKTESRESANITLSSGSNGYNVSFVEGQDTTYKFVKVLQLINNTYLVGCTYTNANDASTSAGFILAKSGYNYTLTEGVNNNASALYTNFQSGVVNNVTQTGCFANSAGQTLPMITLFLTIALLLIKA